MQLTGRQVFAAVVSAGVQTEWLIVAQMSIKLPAASPVPYINLYNALNLNLAFSFALTSCNDVNFTHLKVRAGAW